MVKIDENQEAIALIRMAIDNDNKSRTLQAPADIEDNEPTDSEILHQHWTFGSRTSGTQLDSRALEKKLAPSNRDFISFDERLRAFIAHCFPDDAPRYEELIYVRSVDSLLSMAHWQLIQVQFFKCVTIRYQSMEDWTEARNILRCNPDFHQRQRYDCVIVNSDSPGTTIARLRSLLRCRLLSGKVIDIALVHSFTRTKWKPDTMWDNCQICVESRESSFMMMDYVVRGALLCPVFNHSDTRLHYIMDTVDGDMFLRVNNLS
jgi:hypothetical protein